LALLAAGLIGAPFNAIGCLFDLAETKLWSINPPDPEVVKKTGAHTKAMVQFDTGGGRRPIIRTADAAVVRKPQSL
jgi:hypothetical protein